MGAPFNRTNTDVIDQARATNLVRLAESYGVKMGKQGKDYLALCPFHSEDTPSFTIFRKGGLHRFRCFGCGSGGDAIQFVQDYEGLNFPDAVRRLIGELPAIGNVPISAAAHTQTEPEEVWTPIYPIPASAPNRPDILNRKIKGEWHALVVSRRWAYRNQAGEVIGYVCRFDLPGGGKEVMPQVWAASSDTGECRWRWQSFGKPRPMYGLEKLAPHPNAQVLGVEGEKASDAAQQRFVDLGIPLDKLVVVSWPGGGKAVKHVDFSPLAGRSVGLWPDADQQVYPERHERAGLVMPFLEQPGTVAMLDVWRAVRDVASVKLILPPEGVEDGWDLADPLPAGFSLLAHIKASSVDPATLVQAESVRAGDGVLKREQPQAVASQQVGPQSVAMPLAVDWQTPFHDVNGNGKPLATIENVAEACCRLRVTVRYNVISKEVEVLIPGQRFTPDNAANASLAWLTSACERFRIPTGRVGEFLCYLADQNIYNPVANWILSMPWDGKSRLQEFFNTITAEGEEDDYRLWDLKATLIRRWMISACAAAFEPNGVSAHGVLVLQGEQYLGKTMWFKSLVPEHLGVTKDGLMLKPDDRDSVKAVVSNWLVELGELDATFRRSDIAQLKAFITRDKDVLRLPYARLESHFARRTVFFASVNPRQFLHDPTGNRRFWTIACSAINHSHDVDMQQVWAEVYHEHYATGQTWYLTSEEMAALNGNNSDHEVIDPVRERLQTVYDWGAPKVQWRWMTATDITLELGFDRPSRGDVTQCGQTVLKLNGGEHRKSDGKRLSLVPPRRLS